ncbi:MAG: hypothetical protein EZS28_004086 [Streblomastix strix]|uniref:Uncharacterized protein n=1 Tax=Streblomastix strix TaxID=222440 RepID=A0A5J4X002_9EUKA|nr:MAG: hypothetical protein EZS28_004086 [Streblomastix strix]
MADKQGYDSQIRRMPPIGPPVTLQTQALLELQPLNLPPHQSPRQTQSQLTVRLCYVSHNSSKIMKEELVMSENYVKNQHVKYDPFYVHTISPTKEYYKNDLKTIKDVDVYLDEIYWREQKFAFKIEFDFGMIIERVDGQENEQQITYKINRPLEARTEMRAPTTIRNQMDLADYKRFIRNHIIQTQERTIMDTKEKIVGIFSIMAWVFRLPHVGAMGGRTISSLKKRIMRREIRYIDPEKNNQNLCFFLAYSFITMPDIKADGTTIAATRYKEHSCIAEIKRLFERIYGK